MSNRWLSSVVGLVLVLLVLVGTPVSAAPVVTAEPLSEVLVSLERRSSARVESLNEVLLSAQVTASVVELPVRPGETVAAGDLLVRLDGASFEIQVRAAEAALESARAGRDMADRRADRARRLQSQAHVSEDDLLEAETRLRQARAEVHGAEEELQRARLDLDRTRVEAPFAGVLVRRHLGTGALAAAGAGLVELVATDELEVVAGIAPEAVDPLLEASAIRFVTHDRSYALTVARVSPVVSPNTRTREARFHFMDDPAPPGSDGRVLWQEPAITLPGDYIQMRNGRAGVFVLDSELEAVDGPGARFHELPGADAGRPHRVDLPGETRVIDEGRLRLQPGDRVRLKDH